MTATELQNRIQRKVQELPPDLLQEVYDYMEYIGNKRKRESDYRDQTLEGWWKKISDFSDDFLEKRDQPPLDKSENFFE